MASTGTTLITNKLKTFDGQMLWALTSTTPYWPAIVCAVEGNMEATDELVQVRLCGKNGQILRVKRENIFEFTGIESFTEKKSVMESKLSKAEFDKAFDVEKNKEWKKAVAEGILLRNKLLEQRMAFFEMLIICSKLENSLPPTNEMIDEHCRHAEVVKEIVEENPNIWERLKEDLKKKSKYVTQCNKNRRRSDTPQSQKPAKSTSGRRSRSKSQTKQKTITNYYKSENSEIQQIEDELMSYINKSYATNATDMPPLPPKSEKQISQEWCYHCGKKGDELLYCCSCPQAIHVSCFNVSVEQKEFKCCSCENGQHFILVWAMCKGNWWPAIIVPTIHIPDNLMDMKRDEHKLCVRFFGSYDFESVGRSEISAFKDYESEIETTAESDDYEKAVLEARNWLKKIDEQLKPSHYTEITNNEVVKPEEIVPSDDLPVKCICTLNDPCGENCYNRQMAVECDPKQCPCGSECMNQAFQRKSYPNVEIVSLGEKGHGLRAGQRIPKDTLVIEYVGEIITKEEYQKRTDTKQTQHYYYMEYEKGKYIDAEKKGNKARFVNHSCNPNCDILKKTVNGILRMGFFAKEDIEKGTEITIEYGFGEDVPDKCLCGGKDCSGFIGKKTPKSSGMKVSVGRKVLTPADQRNLTYGPKSSTTTSAQTVPSGSKSPSTTVDNLSTTAASSKSVILREKSVETVNRSVPKKTVLEQKLAKPANTNKNKENSSKKLQSTSNSQSVTRIPKPSTTKSTPSSSTTSSKGSQINQKSNPKPNATASHKPPLNIQKPVPNKPVSENVKNSIPKENKDVKTSNRRSQSNSRRGASLDGKEESNVEQVTEGIKELQATERKEESG